MVGMTDTKAYESQAIINALNRSQAMVELSIEGIILDANDNFLDAMGYSIDEVKGKHHSMFLFPEDRESKEYLDFWDKLRRGEYESGDFKRLGKRGNEVWIKGSYNPIFDATGKPVKVIKFATDITKQVEQERALKHSMDDLNESQRIKEELDKAVAEMSTPVTPIWDGILLLPLVGIVNSVRTSDIMNKSLNKISETRARVFVLDISGVAAVDTGVANQLIKITKATQLMGCEAIISGVSPSIARTIVELGFSIGEVKTTATLRDAFEMALRKVGLSDKKLNGMTSADRSESTRNASQQ